MDKLTILFIVTFLTLIFTLKHFGVVSTKCLSAVFIHSKFNAFKCYSTSKFDKCNGYEIFNLRLSGKSLYNFRINKHLISGNVIIKVKEKKSKKEIELCTIDDEEVFHPQENEKYCLVVEYKEASGFLNISWF